MTTNEIIAFGGVALFGVFCMAVVLVIDWALKKPPTSPPDDGPKTQPHAR